MLWKTFNQQLITINYADIDVAGIIDDDGCGNDLQTSIDKHG